MKQLLLVGGGHTHVEIVRRWGENPVPGWSATVVSMDREPIYSGMVPGFVAGEYEKHELSIDLPSLAERAGVRFVHDRATRVADDPTTVTLAGGEVLRADLASIDIGSTVAGRELSGVARHALASRPIASLIEGVDRALERLRDTTHAGCRVCVVGAGAAGVELAFCLRERLLREVGPNEGPGAKSAHVQVSIVDASRSVLPGASRSLVRRVSAALRRRSIELVLGREVCAVEPGGVRLEDGDLVSADLVLWVTGPAALPLARDSALPIDPRGFLRIEPSFQVEGHPVLFAVGDCASLPHMKRAGVYAVRAGPILDENLRARMRTGVREQPLRRYRPQRDFLTLFNLADGTGIGSKWGVSFEGGWVMRLKDRIDRGFIAKYS